MDFNIYVLGDVRLFADTLNGIAMMFSVASGERINLWAANTNSMGLGMGAFLGMLMALCLLVYNAAFRQRFDFRALIIPLVIYIVLTVPKVRVNVIDAYYRDGAQTVNNVPMGLALPMSAISSIAMAATETLETVFTVPNDSFTRITDDGFVMPLKLLHAMRYTGLTMQDAYPNVTESIAEAVKICLTNNDAFDIKQYQNSGDGFGVFVTALADPSVAGRLVKIYPSTSPLGQVTTCETAAKWISGSMQAYMNGAVGGGGALSLISNSELKVRNFRNDLQKILASNNGNTGSRNLSDATLSSARVIDDIQHLTTASNAEVLQFAQLTLFNPQLSAASQCAQSTDNNSTARCFTYITTEEQWKERSAAEASGFLSIMRDGQNLLILLSVTLFPIMVLIVVLQGLGGLKVVMSYLLYTISAYMWIPVAAMINWYVQLQLHDELQKWRMSVPAGVSVADAYLSAANAPLFYDAISKKLALANSVMASVPMICMGLFSGMLMTMNRLADKMNPQSGYDASVNTPNAVSRDSLAKVGSSVSFDSMDAVGKQNGLAEMGALKQANAIVQANANMKANSEQLSHNLSKMAANDIYASKDVQSQVDYTKAFAKQLGFSEQQANNLANTKGSGFNILKGFALSHALATGTAMNEAEQNKMMLQAAAAAGISLDGVQGAVGANKAFAREFANLFQKNVTDQDQFQRLSQTTGIDSKSLQATNMTSETATKLWQATTTGTFKEMTTEGKGYSDKITSSQTFSNAKSMIAQTTQSNNDQMQVGLSLDVPFSHLANMNNKTDGRLAANLEKATANWGDDYHNRVNQIMADGSQITANRGDMAAVKFQAMHIAAMQETDANRRFAANHAVMGALASQPINQLSEVKNDGLEQRVLAHTGDVAQNTQPAFALNKGAVDSGAATVNRLAQGAKADAESKAYNSPRSFQDQVPSYASIADGQARDEERKREEAIANNRTAAMPRQPTGDRQLAEYTGTAFDASVLEQENAAAREIDKNLKVLSDPNASVGDKLGATLGTAMQGARLAAASAGAAITGAKDKPVVLQGVDPMQPTGQLVNKGQMKYEDAVKDGYNITNMKAFSPQNVAEQMGFTHQQINNNSMKEAVRTGGDGHFNIGTGGDGKLTTNLHNALSKKD